MRPGSGGRRAIRDRQRRFPFFLVQRSLPGAAPARPRARDHPRRRMHLCPASGLFRQRHHRPRLRPKKPKLRERGEARIFPVFHGLEIVRGGAGSRSGTWGRLRFPGEGAFLLLEIRNSAIGLNPAPRRGPRAALPSLWTTAATVSSPGKGRGAERGPAGGSLLLAQGGHEGNCECVHKIQMLRQSGVAAVVASSFGGPAAAESPPEPGNRTGWSPG